jgi:tetratricopeptide (TPR) repeat protein
MFSFRPIASVMLGAGLLQACSLPPAHQELMVQPTMQVRDAASQTAVSYYQMGRYHEQRGDLDLALVAYNYSMARDGAQLEARSAAAAIHAQQGRLEQARTLLLAVVADYPKEPLPYNNLGYVHYLEGNYAEAASMLRDALALNSDSVRARNNLRLAEEAARQNGGHGERMASVPATAEPPGGKTGITRTAGTMELVELGPNVFELKRRTAPPVVAASPSTPPAVPPDAPVIAQAPTLGTVASTSRVEIANGNGITGMARRIKLALARQGVAVSRLTNARPFNHPLTVIEYRLGHEQYAQQLRDALRGHAELKSAPTLAAKVDVRLILGKDATGRLAWQGDVDAPPAALALLTPRMESQLQKMQGSAHDSQ